MSDGTGLSERGHSERSPASWRRAMSVVPRRVSTVALALTIAALVTPALAHATYPGTNGLLSFTGVPPGEPLGVFTADPAGGDTPTRIFGIDEYESQAAWSPDGSKLVFL